MKKILAFQLILWIIISVSAVAQAAMANSPWPCKGHDLKRSSQSPYIGAQNNTLKWCCETGGIHIQSSPAIGIDGTIYIGGGCLSPETTNNKKIFVINPNGNLKWAYTTSDDVISSPSISADGTIYIGSFDQRLYALNSDGSLKWYYQTDSKIDTSPVI